MAERGVYPSPPSPWSAASYTSNYQPLTSAGGGGPFLQTPPGTTFYVIEYDSAGHIWVAPPRVLPDHLQQGPGLDASPDVCMAAVG